MTTEEIIIAVFRILCSLPVLVWPFPGAIIAMLGDLADLFLRDAIDLGGVGEYQQFDKWLDQAYMLTFLIVALRWQPTPRNIAVVLYLYRVAGVAVFEITQERDLLILFPNVFEFWFVFVSGAKFFHLDVSHPDGKAKGRAPVILMPGSQVEAKDLPSNPTVAPGPPPGTHSDTSSITGAVGQGSSPGRRRLAGLIPFRYTPAQLAAVLPVLVAAKLLHEYSLHVGRWFDTFTISEMFDWIWRILTPPF